MDAYARKKTKSLDPESVIRVINEDIIEKSVKKQKLSLDKLAEAPSIILSFKSLYPFSTSVFSLCFTEIRKIENLEGFRQLTVLKLDNNNISKIENLTSLTTLEVLGMSVRFLSTILERILCAQQTYRSTKSQRFQKLAASKPWSISKSSLYLRIKLVTLPI
jgi:hypothetical protein